MTQKEIVKLKSCFDDFEYLFYECFTAYSRTSEKFELIDAAINARKCCIIAEVINDQHLLGQSEDIMNNLRPLLDAEENDIKIAINVYGGMVQSVYADGDVEVEVYDEDTEEFNEARETELDAIIESPNWKQVW